MTLAEVQTRIAGIVRENTTDELGHHYCDTCGRVSELAKPIDHFEDCLVGEFERLGQQIAQQKPDEGTRRVVELLDQLKQRERDYYEIAFNEGNDPDGSLRAAHRAQGAGEELTYVLKRLSEVVEAGQQIAQKKEPQPLCVVGRYCRQHGFIHGAEAEELREKLEPVAKSFARVRAVLEDVDARDSVAWLEAKRAVEEGSDTP